MKKSYLLSVICCLLLLLASSAFADGANYCPSNAYSGTMRKIATVGFTNPVSNKCVEVDPAGNLQIAESNAACGASETDPVVKAINGIVKSNTSTISAAGYADVTGLWTACTGYLKSDGTCDTPSSMVYPGAGIPLSTGSAWDTSITNNSANWNTCYGWGNHASAGYLTSETDPIVKAINGVVKSNTSTISAATYSDIVGLWTTCTGFLKSDGTCAVGGSGDVVGPATNSADYIPQWNGVNSKTLKNGLAVPAGGLAGLDLVNPIKTKTDDISINHSRLSTSVGYLSGLNLSGTSGNGAYITFLGDHAGVNNTTGYNNTGVGSYALGGASNITGRDNTGTGYDTLGSLTSGIENTAVGSLALPASTTSSYNTAVGANALLKQNGAMPAGYNTAIGSNSLYENLTGGYNTAVGFESVHKNTTGTENVGMGGDALWAGTAGIRNSALGYKTLAKITGTSNYNVGIGSFAGSYLSDWINVNSTANDSIYIGYAVTSKTNNETNAIVIGANAISEGSNAVVLGHTDITKTYLRGVVSNLVQSVTCTAGAGVSALTITPTSSYVEITNSDADGCDITMDETAMAVGSKVTLCIISNAGGTVNFADTAGVTEIGSTFAADIDDCIDLVYGNPGTWRQRYRSAN